MKTLPEGWSEEWAREDWVLRFYFNGKLLYVLDDKGTLQWSIQKVSTWSKYKTYRQALRYVEGKLNEEIETLEYLLSRAKEELMKAEEELCI